MNSEMECDEKRTSTKIQSARSLSGLYEWRAHYQQQNHVAMSSTRLAGCAASCKPFAMITRRHNSPINTMSTQTCTSLRLRHVILLNSVCHSCTHRMWSENTIQHDLHKLDLGLQCAAAVGKFSAREVNVLATIRNQSAKQRMATVFQGRSIN